MNPNDVAPAIMGGLVMLIPIIAILTAHQRKMAEILHRQPQIPVQPQQDQLQQEIRELKQLVHQQAIALDTLTTKLESQSPSDVQHRLTGSQS